MGLPPLVFQPIGVEKVWGGAFLSRIRPHLNREAVFGESWEISDYGDLRTVVSEGDCVGLTLSDLITRNRDDLLGCNGTDSKGRFPLLLKILHACGILSLQVHPDDATALRLNDANGGKEEAWLVLASQPGSRLALGLKSGITNDCFFKALPTSDPNDLVNWIEVKEGDLIPVPAGLVHAIEGGLLLMEIQQTSDATYRIHDWGRQGRELHLEKAAAAIDPFATTSVTNISGINGETVVFDGEKLHIRALRLDGTYYSESDVPEIVFVFDGCATLTNECGSVQLNRFSNALIPARPRSFELKGEALLLIMSSR